MKKMKLRNYEILSAIFIIIIGILLHFAYEWFNENQLVAIFSSTNESVWEHLKIIFFPYLFTTIIGSVLYKNKYPNYLCNKTKGIFLSLSFIIIFFYTYSGIVGKNIHIFNILSFFIAIVIGQIYSYKNRHTICKHKYIAIMFLLILTILFIIFTFNPPALGIFTF